MQALESYSRAHDNTGAIRDAQQRADEAALERGREEVISYLEGGFSDVEELIPMLDGDGTTLLCRVLLKAYREGVASKWYSDAEQLVDALAKAEADREALA